MAKKSGFTLDSTFFLQLCLGAFFVALGIMGLTEHDSGWSQLKRAFGKNDTLNVVMAVVELAMGAVLVLGLFMSVSANITKILGLALFGLWALYMVISFIVNNFVEPNFVAWLYNISWNAVILVSIWMVGRRTL
jgi:hypothetical protein